MRELLRQPRLTNRSVADQVFAISAVSEGWLDAVATDAVAEIVWRAAQRLPRDLVASLSASGAAFSVVCKATMRDVLARALAEHA